MPGIAALEEADRHAHDHGRSEAVSGAPAHSAAIVDLFAGGIGVFAELNFRHRHQASDRHADGAADNAFFGEGGIEDAALTIFGLQVEGDAVHAAARADVETAKLLVKNGASLKVAEGERYHPLVAAVQGGSAEMVKFLLELGPSDKARRLAMQTAAGMKREALVKLLADENVTVDAYSLLKLNKLHELDKLLEKDPKLVDAPPALRYGYGGTMLHVAVRERLIDGVKLYLKHGAKVDTVDRQGYTPLHAAAVSGSLDCVKLLLEKGAKLNAKDGRGMTPLDVIDPEKNRDLHIRTYRGEDLLYTSIREFLTSKGAESGLFIPEKEKRTGEIAKEQRDRGPGVQVGRWTLYPGGRYKIDNAAATIIIRNADGKKVVEAIFKNGDRQTKVTHDPAKEKPLKLTRTGGKMVETIEYKTINDFRAAEPDLLEQFQQLEKDAYAGAVPGKWELNGPAAAKGPLVLGGR